MSGIDTDVLVVGAGTTGIPAGIAAARGGSRVLLLEQAPVIGGTITRSYVAMPCGRPCTGIYQEMLAHLAASHQLTGGTDWYLPSSWLTVMHEMLRAEPRIELRCGVDILRPIVEDAPARPRVAGVILRGSDGAEIPVRAAVTIDATGTGAVAHAAGCRSMYGRESRTDFDEPHASEQGDRAVQHCTWMYVSQKLASRPAFDMTRLEHVRLGVLVSGVGWFHSHRERALAQDPGVHLHWGCAVACRDTLSPEAVAEAQIQALGLMERDLALLRENGYAVHLAPALGVRETRRILGEKVITELDLRSGRLPDDTVAVGIYCLDIWGTEMSREEARIPGFGIPYPALIPRDVDGLLLAGKSISGTHLASSAYRVQPILTAAAQAAGVAAALAAKSGLSPRDLPPAEIRCLLTSPGQAVRLQL